MVKVIFGHFHFQFSSFHATIHGHNEFSAKACPCFDVKKELVPYFDKGRTPFSYSLLILCFSMRCGCFYRNPSDAAAQVISPSVFRSSLEWNRVSLWNKDSHLGDLFSFLVVFWKKNRNFADKSETIQFLIDKLFNIW